jgi:hypothetical protein
MAMRQRLRAWYGEYLRSLKAIEAEEALDLYLYRPLAFVLTKLLQPTPVTPNQVSVASLLCGLLAGWCFWIGSTEACLAAAVAYFACNTFDCADGQLARLRGGTLFGYLVDGCIDYVASIAIFVGIAHGLDARHPGAQSWYALSAAAGLCYAWQCAILDRKRKEWLYWVHGKRLDAAEEHAFYLKELQRCRREGGEWLLRAMILAYHGYYLVWTRLTPKRESPPERTESQIRAWAACQRPVLRLATWMGPTTQMSLIMLAGAVDRPDVFLWGTLSLGNAWALWVLVAQRHASLKYDRVSRELSAAPAE